MKCIKNIIWAEVPLISEVHFLKEILTELQRSLLSLYFGFLMPHLSIQLVHRWGIVYYSYFLLYCLKLKQFVSLIGKMLMILIHYQHSYSWSDGRLFSKKLEICRILLICSMHTPLWSECHSYVFKHSEVCQKNCLCICNFIASLTHPS